MRFSVVTLILALVVRHDGASASITWATRQIFEQVINTVTSLKSPARCGTEQRIRFPRKLAHNLELPAFASIFDVMANHILDIDKQEHLPLQFAKYKHQITKLPEQLMELRGHLLNQEQLKNRMKKTEGRKNLNAYIKRLKNLPMDTDCGFWVMLSAIRQSVNTLTTTVLNLRRRHSHR